MLSQKNEFSNKYQLYICMYGQIKIKVDITIIKLEKLGYISFYLDN